MDILGIHLEGATFRTALLQKRQGKIEVSLLQEHVQEDAKKFIENFKGWTASGIPSKDLLIRSVEMNIPGGRHIEEALAFQAEAKSHFQPGEMLTVPLVQRKEKGAVQALLFTTPREALQRHLVEWERIGISPDSVSAVPLALYHFVRWKFPDLSEAMIVHLGMTQTTCVFLQQGELKKAYAIAMGVETLLTGLLEDRRKVLLKKEIEGAAKQIDLLLFKPGLNPQLSLRLTQLRQELAKAQRSFSKEKIPVIFTGHTDAFFHFCEFLIDGEQKSLTLQEQKFSVSIGLALEPFHPNPLQFRKEEFFPKKNWRQLGLYALSLFAASCLFSAALFGFKNALSSSRKGEMLASFRSSGEGSVEEKIDRWIASIEASNKEYPYLPQVPRVAEVFAWFSSHPLLQEFREEGDPIDLREIHYQLEKFPRIGALKEPYLAKVELEFRCKNGTNARKFHEALRQGDDLVNPRMEIGWDSLSDGYRASFFLKNRSPHVP